ncbi:MAG: hypothetical protein M9904_12335 [Chitinophagaceae bacterium]|nr:hypothetical protein [Chitinophagaceae bacterium]
MKQRLFTLAAGLFSFFALSAQDHTVASISPSEFQRNFAAFSEVPSLQFTMNELAYNEEKYRKFKKMRTAGIVLTGVGAGLITTGIVLANSAKNYDEDDWGALLLMRWAPQYALDLALCPPEVVLPFG